MGTASSSAIRAPQGDKQTKKKKGKKRASVKGALGDLCVRERGKHRRNRAFRINLVTAAVAMKGKDAAQTQLCDVHLITRRQKKKEIRAYKL